jgi:membrane fusion protein (multidrug efflux system)
MNAPEPTASNDGNGKRRRLLLTIIGIFAFVGVAWFAWWLLVLSHRQGTDDAYVAGDQVGVSALTPGTVTDVLAAETQRVSAGQVLVKLDRADNEVALQRATGELAQSVRLFRQQQSLASSGDAQVASRRVELAQAEEQLARRQPLLASHAVAAEEVQQAGTAVEVARAALQAAGQQAAALHTLVDGVTIAASPAVQQARSAYLQAWLAARRTVVRAPISGYVARRNVQLGQRVAPGQALLNIIPLENLWVDANFKESQIGSLRIGQAATVVADVYGGKVQYHARVAGFSAGTGAAFALLPAQNASGNWIKVVQRVPVRVTLDPKDLADHPLRIGLSTRVEVDTHDQSGPLLSPDAGAADASSTSVYADDYQAAQRAADAVVRGETPPQP